MEEKKGQDLESTRKDNPGKLLQLCAKVLQAMHSEKGQAKTEHTIGKAVTNLHWTSMVSLFLSSLPKQSDAITQTSYPQYFRS